MTQLALAAILIGLSTTPAAIADDPPTLRMAVVADDRESGRMAEAIGGAGSVVAKAKAEGLDEADVVVVGGGDGPLGDDEQAALVAHVGRGRGLVVLASGLARVPAGSRLAEIVGGRIAGSEAGEATTRIIDAQHPITRGLKGLEAEGGSVSVVGLGRDLWGLTAHKSADRSGLTPMAWVRREGEGRVFASAHGRDEVSTNSDAYKTLIGRAVAWTGGRLVDDAPPNPVVDGKPGPLSPTDSMKHMHMPAGFRVELFAAEPDVVKPYAIAFDPRGRLWVIESTDYPNDVLPEGTKGNDHIKICEDTDGDGRADKFTTFAEGLNIPTGLAFARDGLIVAAAPHILLMRDTDGDDKADSTEILLTGFGRDDTHAVHANLKQGIDNWIWASVGYSGGKVKAGGKETTFRQGIFRFRPDGSDFEFVAGTSNNTWGLGFDAEGRAFASTANNEHAWQVAVPNRVLAGVRGWAGRGAGPIEDHKDFHAIGEVRQVDWFNGYTAASGFDIYTAASFPAEYRNRAAFVCEPTGHLIHADFLVPKGPAQGEFVATDGWNLLVSDDPWTAPVATTVGPDGALWFLDWYNYIVRHNPTPPGFETGKGNAYVTPDRDKLHGRIYRIVHEDAPKAERPALDKAPIADLIAALGHENAWWRLTAQRLLIERNRGVESVPALAKLVTGTIEAGDTGPSAAHALWALQGLGALDDADSPWALAPRVALGHPSLAARRAAFALVPRGDALATALVTDGPGEQPAAVEERGDLLDRLMAIAEFPPNRPLLADAVIGSMARSEAGDRWIMAASVAAAARHDRDFLKVASEYKLLAELNRWPDEMPRSVIAAARIVAEHYARGKPDEPPAGLLTDLLTADPALAVAVLAGLAAGWPADAPPPTDPVLDAALKRLAGQLPGDGKVQTLALVRRWKRSDQFADLLAELGPPLLERIADADADEADRLEAAEQYLALGPEAAPPSGLLDLIGPRLSPRLAAGLLGRVGAGSTDPAIGPAIVERWGTFTPAARQSALALLLNRPEWTTALLDALEQGTIPPNDLALEHRQRLERHPRRAIAERAATLLARGGKPAGSNRQQVVDVLKHVAEVAGDAKAGRVVFDRECSKCHRYGEAGSNIGPDLTGVAAQSKEELLVHILDPNRSVEGNFRQYTLATTDGRVLSGLLASETPSAVELLDTQANKVVVARDEIEEIRATDLSLMPEGFEKLPETELSGLLEFLSARGKYLPLSLAKAATIVTTRGMFFDRENPAERIVFPSWGPLSVAGVPFQLIDPRGDAVPNAIELASPIGAVSRTMPEATALACGVAARSIHILGGISGWGFPAVRDRSVSLIVRLRYADGGVDEFPMVNGEHLADYNGRHDVPGSAFALDLNGRQIRYLAIQPKRPDAIIESIEFAKGRDRTAPIVFAVTAELATRPE